MNVDISTMANTSMMRPNFPRIMSALSMLLAMSITVHVETLLGRVVGVADGDTVTVLDGMNEQHKIRLMGIDAPEKKQAFGSRSKQALSALVFNREVSVEYRK